MDVLENLTIVIPTYERPLYVSRQISFWSSSDVRVVILDGSPKRYEDERLRQFKNMSYLHVDGDFHSRMLLAVQEVKTDFVAVLGDDDFFSKDGLRTCINRLSRDGSIIGCVGRSMRFTYQNGKIWAEQRDGESSEFSSDTTTGLQRLYETYHPGKIGALFYGVYRTEIWKSVVQSAYSSRFSTGYIHDTIIRAMLTYRGAIGVEETLMWFCSAENPPIKSAPGMNRKLDLYEWLTSSKTVLEKEECRRLLVSYALHHGQDGEEDVGSAIDFVLRELQARYAAKAQLRRGIAVRLRVIAMKLAPTFLKRIVKRWIPTSLRKSVDWTYLELHRAIDSLVDRGVKVSDADVRQIAALVHASHS